MKSLIVLIGPTGVGKTDLSLALAKCYKSPIISADSRQIYATLQIGTAAPTPEQLEQAKHYFIGTLQLTDYYSAAQYELDAIKLLDELFTSHDTLILTGGSMMYIDAICKGIDDIPTVDAETREYMMQHYEKEGLEALCKELKLLDPEYYKSVDLKNPKRVIHALEICYMTGKTYTSFRTKSAKQRPFRIIKIGLTRDREELYDRINHRVDKMMEDGLLEEARQMYPFRHLNALNTVGYKELFKYFDGEWTLPFAIEKIKQNSRIYSRKQMTWFKRDSDITWFHPDQQKEIKAFDFMKMDDVAIYNAIATAEGAIMEAIKMQPINLHKSRCLVLGYGRCAKVLAAKLKGMDAQVTVCARNKTARSLAKSFGLEVMDFTELKRRICQYDHIFNTVPKQILKEDILRKISKESCIIDIASYPGGTNHQMAEKLGICAKLCPSLPGIYSPKSSGIMLAKKVLEISGEIKHGIEK